MITVTTPLGTTRQSTFGHVPPTTRELLGFVPPAHQFQLAPTHGIASSLGATHSRSNTPHIYQLPHTALPFDANYSPGFPTLPSTNAVALLGNLSNRNPVESQSTGEFNHAIQYLNKIKTRYSDDQNIYKQFLDILQAYQREQRHLQDVSFWILHFQWRLTTASVPGIRSGSGAI
jgi:paired amphipathic helix protein Sin3a